MKNIKRLLCLILIFTLLATVSINSGMAMVSQAEETIHDGKISYGDTVKRDGPVDTPWTAQWIWGSDNTSMHNWLCMRKTFKMSSVPDSVIARIAVDSRYWLWVNGEIVIEDGQLKRGPTRDDTYFEYVDITPYLKTGINVVAVLGWYYGNDSSYFSYKPSGQAAFVMEADLGDGNLLKTDSSWKVKKHTAFLNRQALKGESPSYRIPEEHHYYDARQDYLFNGWQQSDYDDSSWSNATVYGNVGDAPWNDLWERSIPQMKYWDRTHYKNDSAYSAYKNTATTQTVRIEMKLPYNMQLQPYLKVDAPAGVEIQMLSDGTEPSNTYYITKAGVQEFEGWQWMSAQTITYVVPAGVKILDLKYRQSGYDTGFAGSFTSEDSALNQLWMESLYTLYITMRDNYMDCPDRERAQWWGDVTSESAMTFYALDPDSYLLYRKGVDTVINWRYTDKNTAGDRYNVLQTVVPITNSYFELPLQQLAGICGFWNYYLYTGEMDFAEQVYQPSIDYLKRWDMNDDGLVMHRAGSWDWADWGSDFDVPVMENAFYYMACEATLKIADTIGEIKDIAFLNERMDSIKNAYDKAYWTGTAYHADSSYYQTHSYSSYSKPAKPDDRANALAVLSGLAGKDKYENILSILKVQMNASPYMEKYVLDAMFKMDYDTEAITRMKTRYAEMLADDMTTLWEDFRGYGTKNHAWSGGPLISMSANIAGVAPDTAGYEQYHVIPQLGNLNNVSAKVPSVKGDINVNISRSSSSFTLKLSSPANTVARVAIPRFSTSNTRVYANSTVIFQDGKPNSAVNGVVYDYDDENYIYFLVNPGSWTFNADIKSTASASSYNVCVDSTVGGKITVDGHGVSAPYTQSYPASSNVKISAVANDGYVFKGFSGSYGVSNTTFTASVNSPLYFKAVFEKKEESKYYFVKLSNPLDTDMSVKVNGATYSLPCSIPVEKNQYSEIEVINSSKWDFVSLEGDYYSTSQKNKIIITRDIELIVNGSYKSSSVGVVSLGAAVSMDNLYESQTHTQWRKTNLTDGVKLNDGGATTEILNVSDGALTAPTTVTVDLGCDKNFDTFRIYPRGSYDSNGNAVNFIVDYTISVKAEGESEFRQIHSVTGQTNPKNSAVVINTALQTARYVKLSVSKLGAPIEEGSLGLVHRMQLSEFEIYNSSNSAKNATVSIKGSGNIIINGETKALPFVGNYKSGKVVSIEPCTQGNYKFSKWMGDISTDKSRIYIKPYGDIKLEAVFEEVRYNNYAMSSNLALGKTVTATNELTGNSAFSAAYLTDGILNSTAANKGFSTNGLGATEFTTKPTIDIDFGTNINFNSVTLYPRTDVKTKDGKSPNFPVSFNIQVKLDGENLWRTVSTITDTDNPMGKPSTFNFALQNARYVRIAVAKISANASDESINRIQLCEIAVNCIPTKTENLALGGTVTSNDSLMETATWSCTNLIDSSLRSQGRNVTTGVKGFTSNGYSSPNLSSPIWINVNMNASKTFDRVTLYPRSDIDAISQDSGITPNFPTKYDIQAKINGTYQTVASVDYGSSTYNINAAPQEIVFDPVTSTDVRILVYRLGQNTWDEQTSNCYRLQLCEFEVGYAARANIAASGKVTSNNTYEQPNGYWSLNNLIDNKLYSDGVNSTTGIKGYTSEGFASPNLSDPIWINVNLPEAKTVDKVILYPRSDTHAVSQNSGITANFPTKYDIQAKDVNGNYVTVASVDYGSENHNIGFAPQAINFSAVNTTDIRLVVHRLSQPAYDDISINKYRLQLCEIAVIQDSTTVKEGNIGIVAETSTSIVGFENTLNFTANVNVSSQDDNRIVWSIENADGTTSNIGRLIAVSSHKVKLIAEKSGTAYIVARFVNGMDTIGKLEVSVTSDIQGDINGDDSVDLLDLLRYKRYVADAKEDALCDVDRSGSNTADDLVLLKKIVLGLYKFSGTLGDVDGNGRINADDINELNAYLDNKVELITDKADANKDGTVTILDADAIKTIIDRLHTV